MPKLQLKLSLDVYEVNKTNLHTILRNIKEGRLQLPNLQRSWRWPDEHVVSLLESVAVNHPVGAVMSIETGGELKFENRGFEGTDANLADRVSPSELMLDGQQRCTALFQACFSENPVSIEAEKVARYRRYFFDMAKVMYSTDPVANAIISLPVDWRGIPKRRSQLDLTNEKVQFENGIFPINEMFRFDEWEARLHAFWDEEHRDRAARAEALQTARDFRAVVVQHFVSCQVPVIVLRRGMSVAGVCKVYENLNSKGVPLDAFDLLIAHFAAEGHSLRDDWYGRKTETGIHAALIHKTRKLLSDIEPKQFLQAVVLASGLSKGVALGIDKTDILSLQLDDYKTFRQPVFDGFLAAARFMTDEKVFAPKMMPSMLHILALAAIFAHIGAAGQRHDVREKLHKWLWNSIYSSAFEASANKAMAYDVPQVVDWLLNDAPEPESLRNSIVTMSDIKVAKRSGNFYKAVATGIARLRAMDFATGVDMTVQYWHDSNIDDHHVFPVAWCKNNGIPADLYDSVMNKTPLSARTNRQIGGLAPSQYLRKIEESFRITPEALDANIATHGIESSFLRNDDFYGFYETRQKHIVKLIEADTGRKVISDDDIQAIQARAAREVHTDEDYVPEGFMWSMNSREGKAYLKATSGGYVVLAGSHMAADTNPSLNERFIAERDALIASGTVRQDEDDSWLLLEDYKVKSSSQAFSVFSGQKAVGNGWRDRDGNACTPSATIANDDLLFPEPDEIEAAA